jgi:hypothetical protein
MNARDRQRQREQPKAIRGATGEHGKPAQLG